MDFHEVTVDDASCLYPSFLSVWLDWRSYNPTRWFQNEFLYNNLLKEIWVYGSDPISLVLDMCDILKKCYFKRWGWWKASPVKSYCRVSICPVSKLIAIWSASSLYTFFILQFQECPINRSGSCLLLLIMWPCLKLRSRNMPGLLCLTLFLYISCLNYYYFWIFLRTFSFSTTL